MIEIADLETFLQQVLADEYAVEAQAACDMATAVVESHCRRTFAEVADDEISLRWRPMIVLPSPPVSVVTAFEVDGVASAYEFDERGGIWPSTRGDVITVTYTHGFPVIPEVVRLVAVRVAARIFKNPQGRTSFNADNMNFQSVADVAPRILTGDEMAALRRYRLHQAQ